MLEKNLWSKCIKLLVGLGFDQKDENPNRKLMLFFS